MKKLIFLILCGASLSIHAEIPTESSVKKLVDIVISKQMMQQTSEQTQKIILQMQQKIYQDPRFKNNKEQQEIKSNPKVQAILNKYTQEMSVIPLKYLASEEFKNTLVSIYQKAYSQQEIDAMNNFYSSKEGQSIIAKLPQVTAITLQAMEPEQAKIFENIIELVHQMSGEIKAAIQ